VTGGEGRKKVDGFFNCKKGKKLANTDINSPVLLFDGVCNLCNASVQWVLQHDPKGIFKFAALQSATGQAMLRKFGFSQEHFDTVILADGERIFTRSDAPLEIARRLGGAWALFYVFKFIPRGVRNAVYDWVARNRYRWFGRKEACMLPRPEWKDRFLDDGPSAHIF
jgi:predicted DCC family thiol-disulfide oxidoreductase YuxK